MHDDIFTYTVPSLLTAEEQQADVPSHICHPRTHITKLVNFSTSRPGGTVRIVFRGNGQRADVMLATPEARALYREIGRVLNIETGADDDA